MKNVNSYCQMPLREKYKKLLHVMRFSFVLFTFLLLNANAVFASKSEIRLQLEEVTIKEALKEIEKQSDYTFLYNDANIDVNQVVTLNASESDIYLVLDALLANTNIQYTLIDNQIVLTGMQQVEKKSISGQITDSDTEQGLAGVTILEKGTSNGTITDLDGNFTLTVAENATLVLSYVGYVTEEIPVAGRTNFNLSLVPDILTIEDLVVIGYGTVKKSDLTGSVASVSADELSQSASAGIDQALQGRTAGVMVTSNSGSPGVAPSVRIRGTGTITNPDPFYVIDGIPMSAQDVGALNPGDIESMEILKDASSAAIYGSRGANGVILITTKRGTRSGKGTVNYDGYEGFQSLAKKYEVLNAEEYITVRNDAGNIPEDPLAVPSTDWQDEIFRKAKIKSHQLSFLGGSETSRYAVIGSYFFQEGIIYGSEYERVTFRVNTDTKIKDWLTIGENITYSYGARNRVEEQDEWTSAVTTALTMDPALEVYDETGNWTASNRTNTQNPVATIEVRYDNEKIHKLVGNAFAEVKPVDWLILKSSFGVNRTNSRRLVYLPEFFVSADFANPESQLLTRYVFEDRWSLENTATFIKSFGNHDLTVLVGQTAEKESFRFSNSYVKQVPSDPNLWFYENSSDPVELGTYGDVAPDFGDYFFPQGQPYDNTLFSLLGRAIYSYKGIIDVTASVRRDGSSKFGKDNKYGIFPSFAAGWKISEMGFMENAEYIDFLKLRIGYGVVGNQEIPPYKAFAPISPNRNYTTGLGEENQTTRSGSASTTLSNEAIKWESVEQKNVGLDFSVLNNKLTLNVDYFIRTTKEMLVAIPLTGIVGVGTPPTSNAGEVENSGLEVNAIYKQKLGDFSFSVSGNIAFIKNEVLSLGTEGADPINSGLFRAVTFVERTDIGQPISSFYVYKTDGYWQSQEEINAADAAAQAATDGAQMYFDKSSRAPGDVKFVDVNGDGFISIDDRDFLGSPHPTMTYGASINLEYKGLDLKIFGQGVSGNKVFQGLIYYHENVQLGTNMSKDMLDSWEQAGDDPKVPYLDPAKASDNLRISDRFLKDGAYFRIKNVQLGYNLPASIIERFGVQKFRIYVGGQNLISFHKYSGFDPEIGRGNTTGNRIYENGNLDIGIDRGNYPVARSVLIGVNVSF